MDGISSQVYDFYLQNIYPKGVSCKIALFTRKSVHRRFKLKRETLQKDMKIKSMGLMGISHRRRNPIRRNRQFHIFLRCVNPDSETRTVFLILLILEFLSPFFGIIIQIIVWLIFHTEIFGWNFGSLEHIFRKWWNDWDEMNEMKKHEMRFLVLGGLIFGA